MKRWFVFYKNELLLKKHSHESFDIPLSDSAPTELKPWTHVHNITPMDDGTEVKTYQADSYPAVDDSYELCDLRKSFYKLPQNLYLKAGKCEEILYWDMNTRYCGVCGGPMKMHTDISKRCTQCGKEVWPQLSTAVIVLISRGDDVLLVHARNFKSNFYGLVAGFVETGETLEEALQREVMEETGITIRNIRYYASQPWPYPCGLMVGFYAEYVSGDIRLQQSELSAGGWFDYRHLPQIPEKLSIARRLIDHWIAQKTENEE